jgi:transcriptional regulator with PAS, ATPase and Fis domain
MSDNMNAPLLPASQNSRQMMWQTQAPKQSETKSIVYQSETMNQLMKMVERVAPSTANVLILGESGTGKELIAHAIHDKSNRKGKPFVAINCGALRETLLESELFGHEKGSFTGAYQKKIGLAEAANGGTLFLDEIGELAQGVQAKLLRFLQEGEVYRVGGKDPIKVDVRVICATNRDLEKEVAQGNFREDLFYRINTISISVPPLRRRKEDIPALINHFLTINNQYMNRARSMDAEAMKAMASYDWPGNIRELQNVCERVQILSDGHTIMLGDIPDNIRTPEVKDQTGEYDPAITLGELEKRYIIKALEYFEGNKTQAANALGITIKTLYNKLHEYGEFDKYAIHSRPMKAE